MRTNQEFESYLDRAKRTHGARFSAEHLASQFIPYFRSNERITVLFRASSTGEVIDVRRGTIGITGGWVPCFLLMLTSRSIGSSHTLSAHDSIGTMEDYRAWKAKESL